MFIGIGNLGTLCQDFFTNKKVGSWVYLTFVKDIYNIEQRKKSNNKIVFEDFAYEIEYALVENKNNFSYSAIYLGETITPDKIMSTSSYYSLSNLNVDRWKYHKIILCGTNLTIKTIYIHERCLDYFTWYY